MISLKKTTFICIYLKAPFLRTDRVRGVTMTTAIISAITGKKVRADVAMTGEITLRGRVLPIGGLKEKLLAAKLAGVKTVCVPKENEADIAELSNEITDGLKIVYVSDIREVLDVALVK